MENVATRPNLKKRLFWEYDYDNINWQAEAAGIIQRVIERGTHDEWIELVRYYGKTKVINVLKSEILFLPDEMIADACNYFNLNPRDLLCYTRKQSRNAHWI
jgi:hypothetical protein